MYRLTGGERIALLRGSGLQAVQADGSIYPFAPYAEEEPRERLFCPYCHARIPKAQPDREFGFYDSRRPYGGIVEIREAFVRKGWRNKRVFETAFCPYRDEVLDILFCSKCKARLPAASLYNDRLSVGVLGNHDAAVRGYMGALSQAFDHPHRYGVFPHCYPSIEKLRAPSSDPHLRMWSLRFNKKKFDVSCQAHGLVNRPSGVSNLNAFRYTRLLVHLVDVLDIPEIAQELGTPTPHPEDHPTRVLQNWLNQYMSEFGVGADGRVPVSIAVVVSNCRLLGKKGILSTDSLRNPSWRHMRAINLAALSAVSYELEEMLSRHMRDLLLTPTIRTFFSAHSFFPNTQRHFRNADLRTADPILWHLCNLGHLRGVDGEAGIRQIPQLFKNHRPA